MEPFRLPYIYDLRSLSFLDPTPVIFQSTYRDVSASPIPPPIAHFRRPAVDLYSNPVAPPAAIVLKSSSSPRAYCRTTPNAEYMTAIVPKVFAVAAPCFITWFNSL
uniref:Uncharacterized protein n=1 Tax=Anopheles atroparvus TaxID=41427 RepID=A0AAG5DB18_ANOAO